MMVLLIKITIGKRGLMTLDDKYHTQGDVYILLRNKPIESSK